MKKFNILCTLLLGIMFVSVVYELYSAGYSFGRGWYLADELIKKDTPTMEMAINRCELEGKKTFFPDTLANVKTGGKVYTGRSTVMYETLYKPTFTHSVWDILKIIVELVYIYVLIRLCYIFIKLIRQVNRGEIFDISTERKFQRLGWLMIVGYALEWLLLFIDYSLANIELMLKEYDIVLGEHSSVLLLVSGVGLLIIEQIFVMARKMREEQELTI